MYTRYAKCESNNAKMPVMFFQDAVTESLFVSCVELICLKAMSKVEIYQLQALALYLLSATFAIK